MNPPLLLLAALLAPPALALSPAPLPAPLQEDKEPAQEQESGDPKADKIREQEKLEAERRAKMGKEGALREAEEARRKGIVPEAVRPVPTASLIVMPPRVLAGSPVYVTVMRFDPATPPNPANPAATPVAPAGQPILPQHVVLRMPNGEEKRLDPGAAARPIPPGVEPAGAVPPSAVRRTFDIGKSLEGVPGGAVQIRYETPGGQPTFGQVFLLTPVKGDLDKIDPKNVYLVIETDLGTMTAEFLADKAPNTARHVLKLAGEGFYDGLAFHRVLKDFMVQAGDPATAGRAYKGEAIKAELSEIPHRKGILAMARGSDLDSATTQFFVVQRSTAPHLDRDYKGPGGFPTTAFGRLVDGYDTLDRIAAVPVGPNDLGEKSLPEKPPTIKRIALAEKNAAPAAAPAKPAAGPAKPPVGTETKPIPGRR